jgi:hypothetical protein
MKNETSTLEMEVVTPASDLTSVAHILPITFAHAKETALPIIIRTHPKFVEADVLQETPRKTLYHYLKPTFSNLVMLLCLVGLFGLYCCSFIFNGFSGLRDISPRINRAPGKALLAIAAIFIVATGLTGCVGYVGADVPGPAFVDVETPGVYVWGGHYHHYDRGFSHRGAISRGRGWHR